MELQSLLRQDVVELENAERAFSDGFERNCFGGAGGVLGRRDAADRSGQSRRHREVRGDAAPARATRRAARVAAPRLAGAAPVERMPARSRVGLVEELDANGALEFVQVFSSSVAR